MNIPYVTKKATRPKPWQGAILGIFGFLTIVLATMVTQIRFRLNPSDVEIVDEQTGGFGGVGRLAASRRQSI